MRTIDTGEYISSLRQLTEEGYEVQLVVSGNSMSPFLIHQRDSVYFKKPDRDLRSGDIVLYQRNNGQYVMHRIRRVRKEGIYLVGDAQTEIEGPIERRQIFALVTAVRRKGRWIGPGDFRWEFFARVWIRVVPLRRGILSLYSLFRGFYRGRSL